MERRRLSRGLTSLSYLGIALFTLHGCEAIVGTAKPKLNLSATNEGRLLPGNCHGIDLELKNRVGEAKAFTSATRLSLDHNSNVQLYSDQQCQNTLTSLSFSSEESSKTIYVRASTHGSHALEVEHKELNTRRIELQFAEIVLELDANSNALTASCEAINWALKDTKGDAVSFDSDQFASIEKSPNLDLFIDSSCSVPVSMLDVAANSSSGTFYARSYAVGSHSLELLLSEISASHTSSWTNDTIHQIFYNDTIPNVTICSTWSSGKVRCFGKDAALSSHLNLAHRTVPSETSFFDGINPSKIASGEIAVSPHQHYAPSPQATSPMCYISNEGALHCLGYNSHGQVANGSTSGNASVHQVFADGVTDVAVSTTVCAIRNGDVYCWGRNDFGQVGRSIASGTNVTSPHLAISAADAGNPFIKVKTNGAQTCAISSAGQLYCWGETPTEVFSSGIEDVYLGYVANHRCAKGTDGSLHCWGTNDMGQVGVNPNSPTANARNSVSSPMEIFSSRVEKAIVRGNNTCAIANNDLYCWGWDEHGQVGDGAPAGGIVHNPVLILPNATDAEIFYTSTERAYAACGISEGDIYCWGEEIAGLLGDRASQPHTALFSNGPQPAPVKTLDGSFTELFQMRKGEGVCAINTNMELYCWGTDEGGSLGVGKPDQYPPPSKLQWLEGAPGRAVRYSNKGPVRSVGDGDGICMTNTVEILSADRGPISAAGLSSSLNINIDLENTSANNSSYLLSACGGPSLGNQSSMTIAAGAIRGTYHSQADTSNCPRYNSSYYGAERLETHKLVDSAGSFISTDSYFRAYCNDD